jgi:hypothetical protein
VNPLTTYPGFGVTVSVAVLPAFTVALAGEIVPPAPAVALT